MELALVATLLFEDAAAPFASVWSRARTVLLAFWQFIYTRIAF
jgi:hypothetical protein